MWPQISKMWYDEKEPNKMANVASWEKLNIYLPGRQLLQIYFSSEDAYIAASLRLMAQRPPKHSVSYVVCHILKERLKAKTHEEISQKLMENAKRLDLKTGTYARDLIVGYFNGGKKNG